MDYKIYTDGSHLDKQNNGRLGCGGVLVNPNLGPLGERQIVDKFSMELLPSYLKMTWGTDKVSNPTAEMLGILMAITKFKKYIRTSDHVTILSDYIGCREWLQGKWKIKEPYIQKIKNDIDDEIKRADLYGCITFDWVKAHQNSNTSPDAYWNNYVDSLAKGLIIYE